MNKFTIHNGLVVPIDRANIDTDAIIPKQFLKSIKRSGFGPNLFDTWRYLDYGEPNRDNSKRTLNMKFELNQPRYQGASILLTRKNFGCGSSREHAPWALEQYGFRVIIASSFADIFFSNCFINGLLLITLSEQQIDYLFNQVKIKNNFHLIIDLKNQMITTLNQDLLYNFQVNEFHKYCLLNGLDNIALTLRQLDKISDFEDRHLYNQPWLTNISNN